MNQIELKYKVGRFMIMLEDNLFERIYKHEGLLKDSK